MSMEKTTHDSVRSLNDGKTRNERTETRVEPEHSKTGENARKPSDEERQGQKKILEETRISQMQRGPPHEEDVVVPTRRSGPEKNNDAASVQEKPKEAHSHSIELPPSKKERRKPLEGHRLNLFIQNRTISPQIIEITTASGPQMTTGTVSENRADTVESHERRAHTEQVPSVVKTKKKVPNATSGAVRKPRLKGRRPTAEERHFLRPEYMVYRGAFKSYERACDIYDQKRHNLSDAEDGAYMKYAGKGTVKVRKRRVVDGKPKTVLVDEEIRLTPPSHQQLQPFAKKVVQYANR